MAAYIPKTGWAEINEIAMLNVQNIEQINSGKFKMEEVWAQVNTIKERKKALVSWVVKDTNRSTEDVEKAVSYFYNMEWIRLLHMLNELKTIVSVNEEVCSICLEEMENGEPTKAMDCMHRFHPFSIVTWLRRNNFTCPLCRQHHNLIILP